MKMWKLWKRSHSKCTPNTQVYSAKASRWPVLPPSARPSMELFHSGDFNDYEP